MKAKKLSQKLTLNKETIASLNENDMNSVRGGMPYTYKCITTTYLFCCVIEEDDI